MIAEFPAYLQSEHAADTLARHALHILDEFPKGTLTRSEVRELVYVIYWLLGREE